MYSNVCQANRIAGQLPVAWRLCNLVAISEELFDSSHIPAYFFFRPRYCISKVWKCIFHAQECSFWCIWAVWPEIIEFIMMEKVWTYHFWFSCEDYFSGVSEARNLGAGQCLLYMHESKHWLPPVHQEARQVWWAVGIECSWFCGRPNTQTRVCTEFAPFCMRVFGFAPCSTEVCSLKKVYHE